MRQFQCTSIKLDMIVDHLPTTLLKQIFFGNGNATFITNNAIYCRNFKIVTHCF